MKKRDFLIAGSVFVSTIAVSRFLPGRLPEERAIAKSPGPANGFAVVKTDAEWHKILTLEQYKVLRQQGTELAHTSPLDKEYGKGVYACAGCELPLFTSETKFDSGTGWPSFYAPIAGAVDTSIDKAFLMSRVEVHCHRCGGHLGHVFDDGPKPTGKRYCMNGVAMTFIAGRSLG